MAISQTVLGRLKQAVGRNGYIEEVSDMHGYVQDWRGRLRGETPIVLRPDAVESVIAVVRICAETGTSIVPQGGNTNMVGGAIPTPSGREVVVSLSRLNRIRDIDPTNYTMTVEAGCILANVQAAAVDAERLFPLSLAAEGSCQIGGNLSTNAGGTAVLRYGNARDLVLGLEVVLPSGERWDGLRRLRKDNTGFDLKQLFLGAEGQLGIITAAVLKLFPLPADTCAAMVAVTGPAEATELLARLRDASGDRVVTFEYLHRNCIDLVLEHIEGCVDPLAEVHQHYVLVELAGGRDDRELPLVLEAALAQGFEAGWLLDAAPAASHAQSAQLWKLRETIPEAARSAGGVIAHDVSVPVSRVAEFLERATTMVQQIVEGVRTIPFGHMGDGNIHFNLVAPLGLESAAFFERRGEITPRIDDLVAELEGSFSAEHGIGQVKRAQLESYRGGVELELMRNLKRVFDPNGIMNPGKVLPD